MGGADEETADDFHTPSILSDVVPGPKAQTQMDSYDVRNKLNRQEGHIGDPAEVSLLGRGGAIPGETTTLNQPGGRGDASMIGMGDQKYGTMGHYQKNQAVPSPRIDPSAEFSSRGSGKRQKKGGRSVLGTDDNMQLGPGDYRGKGRISI